MRAWIKSLLTPGAAAPRPADRARPGLEVLEGREVPTVVFQPKFNAETLVSSNPPAGSLNSALNSPPVYMIFLGTYWNTTQGSLDRQIMTADVQTILNSPYLSGLTEYGSDGRAVWGGSYTLGTSDPVFQMTEWTKRSVIDGVIDTPISGIPAPTATARPPIYVVVTPPNAAPGVNVPGAAGNNEQGLYPLSPFGQFPTLTHEVWTSTRFKGSSVDIDTFTQVFSHELVETISDPYGVGVALRTPANLPTSFGGTNLLVQIADGEPDGRRYGYRLGGVKVQPYWSVQNNAFIVPDGNRQNFFLSPNYNAAGTGFLGTYTLTVQGDQLGVTNDTITINQSNGSATATLNGESATFDQGQISKITADPKGGTNAVNVNGLPANVALDVTNSAAGHDTVTFGANGSLTNLSPAAGPINVSNTSGQTSLVVNDRNDTAWRTVTLTNGAVGVSGLPTINYQAGVNSLWVIAGRGHNTFYDYRTASSPVATIWANQFDMLANYAGAPLGYFPIF